MSQSIRAELELGSFVPKQSVCGKELSGGAPYLEAEQRTENPRVGGSIPPLATISRWSRYPCAYTACAGAIDPTFGNHKKALTNAGTVSAHRCRVPFLRLSGCRGSGAHLRSPASCRRRGVV